MRRQELEIKPEVILPVIDGMVFNATTGELVVGNQAITRFSRVQGGALKVLLEHPDVLLPYENMYHLIYPRYQDSGMCIENVRIVQQTVGRLRHGLEMIHPQLAEHIQTFKVLGYRWNSVLENNKPDKIKI